MITCAKNIVLAQMAPKLGRVKDNINRHLEIIGQVRETAGLLVFPELSLTGYQLKDLVADVAISRDELLDIWRDLGPGAELEFVVGYMERSEGFRHYNAMAHLHLDVNGGISLLHNHRKLNLPTYGMFEEERYYSHGKRLTAYDAPLLGRSGMLICEDFWHQANTMLLSLDGEELDGVRVIIVGSNSPARGVGAGREETDNATTWRTLASATAMSCNCFVFVCQRVGAEDGFVFTGGSEVVAPGGESIARAPLFEEALLSVDLQAESMIREQRIQLPGGSMEDYELLNRELQRIKRERLTGVKP